MKKVLFVSSLLLLFCNATYAKDISNSEKSTSEIVEQKTELCNEIQSLKNYSKTEDFSLLDEKKLKSILSIINSTMTITNLKITMLQEDYVGIVINNKNSTKLYSMVCDLCKKFDLSVPALIVFIPDLYYIGVVDNVLVFGGGCVERLYEKELRAVIAHELAHIKCKHTQNSLSASISVVLLGLGVLYKMDELMNKSKLLGYDEYDSLSLKITKHLGKEVISSCILIPVLLAWVALLMKMKRMQEKEADLKSIEITGKVDDLISALSCDEDEVDNSFFAKFKKVFSTHPTIKERIEYLTIAKQRQARDAAIDLKEELA